MNETYQSKFWIVLCAVVQNPEKEHNKTDYTVKQVISLECINRLFVHCTVLGPLDFSGKVHTKCNVSVILKSRAHGMRVRAADILMHHTVADTIAWGTIGSVIRVAHTFVLRSEVALDATIEVVRIEC